MAFVQIIKFDSSKYDEMKALGDQWEAAASGDTTARRRVMCKDRDSENGYMNIVFFDSYEDAMKNSEHPTTQEFAQKMMGLADGPPTFFNLDVVEDVQMS